MATIDEYLEALGIDTTDDPRLRIMANNNKKVYAQQNKYLYHFGFEYESDLMSWEINSNSNVFKDKLIEKRYINLLKESIKNNNRINSGIIDEKVFKYPDNAKW